ncbi:MAG: BrnT family toxin [Phycisphaerae bacterium]|nr:BrnT family toxin [Phycisphaerae bacterium]
MRIVGFIWLEEIVEKLEVKHQVIPEEVEQLFRKQPRIRRMKKGHYRGEDVYRALSQTDAGRYLVVFFIHKATNEALILSARDMDDKERRSYAR